MAVVYEVYKNSFYKQLSRFDAIIVFLCSYIMKVGFSTHPPHKTMPL